MRTWRSILSIAILVLGTAACARHVASPESPASSSEALPSYELRLGAGVYHHYCQVCHGETGEGDGFNAYNLDPKPRDLSSAEFQKTKRDSDLLDAVRRGGSGVGLSALMPPWEHTLSRRQIEDVVLYVRSLEKPATAVDPSH